MSSMKYISLLSHTYLTDMFLLCFLVLYLNVHNGKEPLIIPFATIVLLIMVLSFFIVNHFKLKAIYTLVPLILIPALFLDFHWVSALMISYLPVLRLEYLHDDAENSFSNITLSVTFILLIGTNTLPTEATLDHQIYFHFILICMLLFYFTGRITVYLMDNQFTFTKNLNILLICSGILIALGTALGLVYHYIIFGMKYIVMLLLNAFVFLLRPFFNVLENVEFETPELPAEGQDTVQDEETLQEQHEADAAVTAIPVETIMGIIFLIILIIAIYIYYKKREGPVSGKEKQRTETTVTITNEENRTVGRNVKAPEGKVRKVYFDFEKWLAQNGMGRYHNETINEWIRRLNIDGIVDRNRLKVYMEARYSDTSANENEFNQYEENIQMMKKEIKAYKKKEK